MRLAIIILLVLIGPIWYLASQQANASRGGRHAHHAEAQTVWIDAHRKLQTCAECRAVRILYDDQIVSDWGNYSPLEIRACGPRGPEVATAQP